MLFLCTDSDIFMRIDDSLIKIALTYHVLQEDAVVKIQSFVRSNKAKHDYNALSKYYLTWKGCLFLNISVIFKLQIQIPFCK